MDAKLSSAVQHIRAVLEQVVKGRASLIDPEEMAAALSELAEAEALAAGRICDNMVFQAPEVTELDEALLHLGTTFLIFQTFLKEMHERKQCAEVNGKVADCLIATRAYLIDKGFELKHIPLMHFKHVVHDKIK